VDKVTHQGEHRSGEGDECSYGGGIDCALAPLHYHRGQYDGAHCAICGKPFVKGDLLFWNRDGHLKPNEHIECRRARNREGYVARGMCGIFGENDIETKSMTLELALQNAAVESKMLHDASLGETPDA
jgi:hypothetical protein